MLGTAGSGKTTLAVLRSLYLSDKSADHCENTLLVTFNRSMVTYLKHLLGNVKRPMLNVENYHKFARGYLSSRGKNMRYSISGPRQRLGFIRSAVDRMLEEGMPSSILARPPEFFDEEFNWIQGHGIKDGKSYIRAERIGRAGTRIARAERPVVAELYWNYYLPHRSRGRQALWGTNIQS